MTYTVVFSKKILDKITRYKAELAQGSKHPGLRLEAELIKHHKLSPQVGMSGGIGYSSFISSMSLEAFCARLYNTKKPYVLGENIRIATTETIENYRNVLWQYSFDLKMGNQKLGERLKQQLMQQLNLPMNSTQNQINAAIKKYVGTSYVGDFANQLIRSTRQPESAAEFKGLLPEQLCNSAETACLKAIEQVLWNKDEVACLGDMITEVPSIVYDDGQFGSSGKKAPVVVHKEPFPAIGVYIPGALLSKPADCKFNTPDEDEVTDGQGKLDPHKLKEFYSPRFLSMLVIAQFKAKEAGKNIIFTVPGIGCGFFVGKYEICDGRHMSELIGLILQEVLKENHSILPNIKVVRYDPFNKGSNERAQYGNIDFRIRPLTQQKNIKFSHSPEKTRSQLLSPKDYEEVLDGNPDDFSTYGLGFAVAADPVAYAGCDAYKNSRTSNEGGLGMATNVMTQMTGVSGQYDAKSNKYRTLTGETFEDAVLNSQDSKSPIELNAMGVIHVVDDEGKLKKLVGNELKDISSVVSSLTAVATAVDNKNVPDIKVADKKLAPNAPKQMPVAVVPKLLVSASDSIVSANLTSDVKTTPSVQPVTDAVVSERSPEQQVEEYLGLLIKDGKYDKDTELKILELIRHKKIDVNHRYSPDNSTLLIKLLVLARHIDSRHFIEEYFTFIDGVLKFDNINVNLQDADGNTALHKAVLFGSHDGSDLLIMARTDKFKELAKILVEKYAAQILENADGRTPNGVKEFPWFAKWYAEKTHKISSSVIPEPHTGAAIDAKTSTSTPTATTAVSQISPKDNLWVLVQQFCREPDPVTHCDIITLLRKYKELVNEKYGEHESPILISLLVSLNELDDLHKISDISSLIKDILLLDGIDVNLQDKRKNTALHRAAYYGKPYPGHQEVTKLKADYFNVLAKLLTLHYKAKFLKNAYNKTPLQECVWLKDYYESNNFKLKTLFPIIPIVAKQGVGAESPGKLVYHPENEIKKVTTSLKPKPDNSLVSTPEQKAPEAPKKSIDDIIKSAVSKAAKNYKNWYDNKIGISIYSWRHHHGGTGQAVAAKFNAMIQGAENPQAILCEHLEELEPYLPRFFCGLGGFHRHNLYDHSFDTFLLTAIKEEEKISNTDYFSLQLNKLKINERYDVREGLIKKLKKE